MTNRVKVAGNIASKNGVTLFFTDGTSQVLPSDSYRTQAILEAILPNLVKQQSAEIDLDEFSISAKLAQATGGAVQIKENGGGLAIKAKGSVINDKNGVLKRHAENAAMYGAKGFKAFMNEFAEMAKKRKHTVEELLSFMNDADLGIADDGSIIGYKILLRTGTTKLVDHRTQNVVQRVGSLVFMPASKVNDDRRKLCGVGLHIANRQYLSSFWSNGSVLALVKIRPDDVISVPDYETSKMRVCAYHIVKLLPDEEARLLVNGVAISDLRETRQMYADAIAGNHEPILERVKIVGDKTTVTPVAHRSKPKKKKLAEFRTVPRLLVAKVKEMASKALPYEAKLKRAQADYDKGMSIREIAKKYHMDRESLGKNLAR